MNLTLHQAAAAMNANARAHELIAANMASSNIPGYKKQEMAFRAVEAGLISNAAGQSTRAAFTDSNVVINFAQGELKRTGLNTDMALEGKGFFEVQLPSGTMVYTRDGEFQLNGSGELVTKQGYLLMGRDGPIQMDRATPGAISVSEEGEVTQGMIPRGKIKLVEFGNVHSLTHLGGGMFAADPGTEPEEATETKVRQGYLEGANTSATAEMTNLIAVMRAFEANQKIVQIQDERMGRLISELGNPN